LQEAWGGKESDVLFGGVGVSGAGISGMHCTLSEWVGDREEDAHAAQAEYWLYIVAPTAIDQIGGQLWGSEQSLTMMR
jgi:hypothetical protein